MQDKIAAHQELERWRSHMSSVVAGCQISKARTLQADITDRNNPHLELLIENLTGSWHLRKSLSSFQKLSESLKVIFPVEAGRRGHRRILPSCPATKRVLMILSSPSKMVLKLRQAVDKYCRDLLILPPYISRTRVVLDFFLPTEHDSHSEIPRMTEIPSTPSRTNSLLDRVSLHSNVPSLSMTNSSKRSLSIAQSQIRVKVKCRGDILAFEYDPGCSFELVDRLIKEKSGIPEDSSLSLTFKDKDGDSIQVGDNEDLYAAVSIYGRKLVLHINA
ncbi:NADH:ubiquinone oxidoreductase 18.4kD subunit [Paramicrosporidium saccamoebae]|uniref:NADH:ubiquinone oxidoreductase 18.4kD subunit n=1 Tax=Paramicrosporidium saccamoebae TaxID=1246581 RepID=A0A2H9TIE1_9FUNG|nr:NADH:ubiquinone oxidoreductase 18.4kD subunit [Paramicrosporidium saccamoebae]